jgi:dipeptidyl aminopeptidase/acylaminoacyl peptidase
VFLLGLGAAAILVLIGSWDGTSVGRAVGAFPIVGSGSGQAAELGGRLLVPREGGLWIFRLPNLEATQLHRPVRAGSITGARWAPDGQTAAFTFSYARQDDPMARSDIYLVDLEGQARELVVRDRPGSLASGLAWAPEGRALYYGYALQEDQLRVRRIERLDIDTNARTIVGQGTLPAISPDGGQLAVVLSDGRGESLVIDRPAGVSPRTLIPPRRFGPRMILGAPRFSPDGRTLAVPVSGIADRAQASPLPRSLGLLGARVALAHGDPWEVYLVDVSGGEPRRLTQLGEDDISVAWSPDGTRLAVLGERGLHLVDRQGGATGLLGSGGHTHADFDWTR